MASIQQNINHNNITLQVNEIFYSIQGEGARTGTANIFIRLAKCNLKCSFCDTDFESYDTLTLKEIYQIIQKYPCKNIIWTGGEPALQISYNVVEYFKKSGYYQAIETNGMFDIPENLNWVTVSPKSNIIKPKKIDEIKLVLKKGDKLPEFSHYNCLKLISPMNFKDSINYDNLEYCIDLVLKNPEWQLTMQMHKILKIK